jgi:NAD(P)-dependent dehydrogenase (short-subunit alcohol dehydrogenase family)
MAHYPTSQEQPLSTARAGHVSIVTGAAREIGAATAERLLAEGSEVVLVDADEQVGERAQELGDGATALVFDITDETAWQQVPDRVDLLVNCAAILTPGQPVATLPVAEFSQLIHVNLTGTFVSCKAVLPAMQRAGRGWIVNMASIAGKEGTPGHSAYSASKGGVIAFTKALAREVAAAGISVNCIAPAGVETRMAGEMTDEEKVQAFARIPFGRFCQPGEVAALISWIGSPECSFTTGFCFDLSGGRASY